LSAILSAAVPAPLMLHFESNAVFLLSNGMWHPGTKRPPPPFAVFDLLDLLVCATPLEARTAASMMVMDKRITALLTMKNFCSAGNIPLATIVSQFEIWQLKTKKLLPQRTQRTQSGLEECAKVLILCLVWLRANGQWPRAVVLLITKF